MIRAELVTRLRAAGCVWAEDEADLLLEAAGAGAGAAVSAGAGAGAVSAGAALDRLVARRVAGEPLEQVLGWASFCGLRLQVAPGVFVPRRRSEFLVRTAIRHSPTAPVVLDLCAGVGALGAAFAASVTVAELHVAELDPIALTCARSNIPPGTELYCGDLYDALPASLRGRVDVLLANAPYVPTTEIGLLPPEARDHEPASALDGGRDGLDLHRRIVADAPRWLAPGGSLFIEVSEGQVDTALTMMATAGLAPDVEVDDELGATIVLGRPS